MPYLGLLPCRTVKTVKPRFVNGSVNNRIWEGGCHCEYHPPLTMNNTPAPLAFFVGTNTSYVIASPSLCP